MSFGENLSNLRKSNGLSQEQLAEKLGLTRQTVSKWETDQSTPDLVYIIKLSEILSVTTDRLIKGADETDKSDTVKEENNDIKPSTNIDASLLKTSYTRSFIFGLVSAAVSLLGIIAFSMLAALKPAKVYWNGRFYEGLLGFLMHTDSLAIYIILCLLFAVGVVLSVFGIVKNLNVDKEKKK